MKTAMSVYIEGDVVEEMRKRHLNMSKTTEMAMRKTLSEMDSEREGVIKQ